MNETQIEKYEFNIASLAVSNAKISDTQVIVTNQEITTLNNRRKLQRQQLPKVLIITYFLVVTHHEINEIELFFENHATNMMQQKYKIVDFMVDEGVEIDQVVSVVEVILSPSVSLQPTTTNSDKPPKSPLISHKPFSISNNPSLITTDHKISNFPSIEQTVAKTNFPTKHTHKQKRKRKEKTSKKKLSKKKSSKKKLSKKKSSKKQKKKQKKKKTNEKKKAKSSKKKNHTRRKRQPFFSSWASSAYQNILST